MRTNIIIDDELMTAAMLASQCKTKKETVEKALQLMIAVQKQAALTRLKGKISWSGDLEDSRLDSVQS